MYWIPQPILDIPPGPQVTVEVTPPRVRVQGPESAVREVFIVETAPISVPSGQAQVERTVPVNVTSPDLRRQVRLFPAQVKVVVKVRGAVPSPEARTPE